MAYLSWLPMSETVSSEAGVILLLMSLLLLQ